jgi:hypothetical protein
MYYRGENNGKVHLKYFSFSLQREEDVEGSLKLIIDELKERIEKSDGKLLALFVTNFLFFNDLLLSQVNHY